jgi:hypothetical protein
MVVEIHLKWSRRVGVSSHRGHRQRACPGSPPSDITAYPENVPPDVCDLSNW